MSFSWAAFGSDIVKGLSFLPVVLTGVMSVESAVSTLPGATKKNLVLAGIDAAAKVGEGVTAIPAVATISALIDAVVTELNKSGIFNHGAAAATPAAPAAS